MKPSKPSHVGESEPSTLGEMTDQTSIQKLEAKTLTRRKHPGIPIIYNYQEVEITDKNLPHFGKGIKTYLNPSDR